MAREYIKHLESITCDMCGAGESEIWQEITYGIKSFAGNKTELVYRTKDICAKCASRFGAMIEEERKNG